MTHSAYWQPQWTTEVKIESGGRYPLGLNRFHNGLEDLLIKSIVINANRLRFFTYCCWAIGDIEKHENCETYADFVKAFVNRETALIMGLCLIKEEHDSIQGSTRAMRALEENRESYDCSFSLMESNPLGVFGLYYVGTAYNFGLIETNEKGVYVLTPSGQELYRLAETRYRSLKPAYYQKHRGAQEVLRLVLEEWAIVNDYDNIRNPENPDERQFYQDLLFHLGEKRVLDLRRDTLAFFMACIEHCYNDKVEFSEDVVRNINYYSSYRDSSGNIHPFDVPAHFEDVHFYWRIYDGHVYFQWWLSRYFEVFLQHLKASSDGSTPDEFFATLDTQQFNATINSFLQTEGEWLESNFGAIVATIQNPATLEIRHSEETITSDQATESPAADVAKLVLVLANLYVTFRNVRRDVRYSQVAANLSSDLWFNVIFQIPNLLQMPVYELLRQVLDKQVLSQHDLIMMEKNDMRRCWFTVERGRYFFQADVSLIWRSAKYSTVIHFLEDMNLISKENGLTRLTAEGHELFEILLREYYV